MAWQQVQQEQHQQCLSWICSPCLPAPLQLPLPLPLAQLFQRLHPLLPKQQQQRQQLYQSRKPPLPQLHPVSPQHRLQCPPPLARL